MSTPPITSNNPFALIQAYGRADNWTGLKGQWPNGFLIFDTPLNGARAGIISFINTYLKRGINTIEKIFPIYAPGGPGTGNDPDAYIRNVEAWSGIPRNKPLTTAPDILKVLKAITRVESGKDWLPNPILVAAYEGAADYTKFPARLKNNNVRLFLPVIILLIGFVWIGKRYLSQ
jgi:hypothetical protein